MSRGCRGAFKMRPHFVLRRSVTSPFWHCECYGDVSTSLMTSAVSRYLGLFFHDFEHTFHVSAQALVLFERVTILRR